jgi:hypothetical protein
LHSKTDPHAHRCGPAEGAICRAMPPTLEVPAGAGPGEEITHVPASSLRYRGGKHGSEKPVQLDRPGTLPEHHSSHAVGHSSEGSSKDFDMIQKMIRR